VESFRVYVVASIARARAAFNLWRAKRLVAKKIIDPNAKCPSCGNEKGTIRFSPTHGALIHRCEICGAEWGQRCIVNPKAWQVSVEEDRDNAQSPGDGAVSIASANQTSEIS
jgi:hypothetical protein